MINQRRRYNNCEDIIIVNIYAPNIGVSQYLRQMIIAIRGEINSNTKIMGDFKTLLIPMEKSSRQKINKETQALNDTLDQTDIINVYTTFLQ